MSKVLNPIHLVLNTYYRRLTIDNNNREALYRFIWSFLKARNCYLYRIGGIQNHIHLLFNLNPTIALSDIVRDMKRESSLWVKRSGLFPYFEKWGKEYYAFGVGKNAIPTIIEYIKNQQEHHRKRTFEEEMQEIFREEGIEWNDIYLS